MDIRIHSQNAYIGIDQNMGYFSINQNHFPMKMKTTNPKLQIEQQEPKLIIDQRRCFSEAGLKNNGELVHKGAQKGRQAALEATARISKEGKELSDIHKGNVIAKQAKRRTLKEKQFTFTMIPKSRPHIEVLEGKISIQAHPGEVHMKLDDYKPDIQYHRGKVEIYLRQKNSIRFEYVGKHLDRLGG